MNERTIEMPLDLAMELIKNTARLDAIVAYAETEKYSLTKKMVLRLAGRESSEPNEE